MATFLLATVTLAAYAVAIWLAAKGRAAEKRAASSEACSRMHSATERTKLALREASLDKRAENHAAKVTAFKAEQRQALKGAALVSERLAAAESELDRAQKDAANARQQLANEKANRQSHINNQTLETRNRMEAALNRAYQAEKAMEMVRLYVQQGIVPGCTTEGVEDCVEVSKRLSVANEAIAVASD